MRRWINFLNLKHSVLVVFAFLIVFKADGQSDWVLETMTTTDQLYDVRFVNADTGWVVGDSGQIIHTTDGGANWHTQNSTTSYDLRSVCFVNDSIGWIAGSGNLVIQTKDGGNHWRQLTSYEDLAILSVSFVDSLHGWYLARTSSTPYNSIVRATSDGGVTWTQQAALSYGLNLFFTDVNNGWMVGINEILHTSDGGKTWEFQSFTPLNASKYVHGHTATFRSVYFVDENHGWAAGSDYVTRSYSSENYGIILKTDDGGKHWIPVVEYVESGPKVLPLSDVYFINQYEGWAIGERGLVLHSTDGGKSWLKQKQPDANIENLINLYFVNSTGWAVGSGYSPSEGRLFKTTNGGGQSVNFLRPTNLTNLTYRRESDSALTLTWTDNSGNESGFEVERKDGNGSFQKIHVAGIDEVTFQDPHTPAGVNCSYRVRATNSISPADYVYTVPMVPSNFTYQEDGESVKFAWNDNSNDEEGFVLEEISETTDFYYSGPTLAPNTTVTTLYSDFPPTTAGGTRRYRVQAFSPYGKVYTSEIQILNAPNDLLYRLESGAMILTWADHSTTETGFEIQRKDGANDYKTIHVASMDQTTYKDQTVSAGIQYAYRVRAIGAPWMSLYTYAAPTAPSNLTFDPEDESLTLTWKDNSSNETAFQVEIDWGTGSTVRVLAANTTQYSESGVTPASVGDFLYKIRAINRYGSTISNEVKTLRAPADLSVNIKTTSVLLTWVDRSSYETGFEVQRKDGNGRFNTISITAANQTTFEDKGVVAGKQYAYRLRAVSDPWVSAFIYPAPIAPSNLAFDYDGEHMTINWKDNSTDEEGFEIQGYWGDRYNPLDVVSVNQTTSVHYLPFYVASTDEGNSLRYRVKAYNKYGGSASDDLEILSSPSDVTSKVVLDGVTSAEGVISWKDRSVNEAGFEVQRKDGEEAYKTITITGPNETTFVDLNAPAGTKYAYRVRAVAGALTSVYSNTIVNTPSDLQGEFVSDDVYTRLTWTDNSNDEAGFIIERMFTENVYISYFVYHGKTDANETSFIDRNVIPGEEHTYRVRGYYGTFPSDYSNEVHILITGTASPFLPVYPNPADDVVRILLPDNTAGEVTLRCWNASGQLKKSWVSLVDFTNAYVDVDVAYLEPGLYFLKIDLGNKVSNARFIKR